MAGTSCSARSFCQGGMNSTQTFSAFVLFLCLQTCACLWMDYRSSFILLDAPCQYWVGVHFASRTEIIKIQQCLRNIPLRFFSLFTWQQLLTSHSWGRFLDCTSLMQISRSTTSQRFSTGLRSGDCGHNGSRVNALSYSRNQFEILWSLWHIGQSC